MSPENTDSQEQAPPKAFDSKAELEDAQRSLRETTLMIEQSEGEIAKLMQRNTAITSHLQQVQSQIGELPIEEIRMAYDSALDAQQRLFVMRGQLEKLQAEKSHYDRYIHALKNLTNGAAGAGEGQGNTSVSGTGPLSNVEMLVNAQESERQRLSRQMHDGPAQALSNFILQTEIAMRLFDVDPSKAKEEMGNLKNSAMSTFQKVRNFIFELRPMMLDDLGLMPTIRRYCDAFNEHGGNEVNVTLTGNERRLESYLEVMVFRAIQELLGNAARHSQATQIKLSVDLADDLIRVAIEDNGKGFDIESAQEKQNLGLNLIRERTEMLGGTFEIDTATGKGARISFSLPIPR